MPDFAQPSDVMWSNPYLMPAPQPDKLSVLANILTGLGAGMSNAAASGRSEWAGIGPGAMLGSQLNANMQQRLEMEQMKKQQAALQWMAFQDKRDERERQQKAREAAAREYGFGVPTTPGPQIMPPDAYGPRVAGNEGGSKNGGMVYNELGSGAGGPFQIMPDTWADIRANNPDLNLPAVMPVDNNPQTFAMHKAAFDRFTQGNARILQKAGFQPTPENLYLAHRFGAGGATALLNAKDDALLADVLPREWQAQNPDMRGQTVAGFKRLAAERMRGVGVPYQANGETTQYTLQPDSLPAFGGIPGGTMMQPGANATPGLTMTPVGVPVAPTPLQPPQVAPGSPQMPVTPVGGLGSPPTPPSVPMPQMPAAERMRLGRMIADGVITPEQAANREHQWVADRWKAAQEEARLQYQADLERWKYERGMADKDAWVALDLTDPRNASMYPGLDPKKQYLRNKVTNDIKAVGDVPVQIDMGNKAVNEIARNRVQNYEDKIRPAAQAAVNEVTAVHSFRQLLDAGAFTGTGAEYKLALAKAGELLGIPSEKATNTQALMGAAAERVLSTIKTLGANPSNADREYLEKAKGGTITATEDGLRRILDIGERLARQTIKQHGEEVGRIRKLDGIKDMPEEFFSLSDAPSYAEWLKANPLPSRAPTENRPPLQTFGGATQGMTPMPGQQRPPLSSFGR